MSNVRMSVSDPGWLLCCDYGLNGSLCLYQMSPGQRRGWPLKNPPTWLQADWDGQRAKRMLRGNSLPFFRSHVKSRPIMLSWRPLLLWPCACVCRTSGSGEARPRGGDMKIGSRKGFNEQAVWTFPFSALTGAPFFFFFTFPSQSVHCAFTPNDYERQEFAVTSENNHPPFYTNHRGLFNQVLFFLSCGLTILVNYKEKKMQRSS